ncbi:hypothetical protein BH11PSE12_BH11PSE12_34480 [soil metagenome]
MTVVVINCTFLLQVASVLARTPASKCCAYLARIAFCIDDDQTNGNPKSNFKTPHAIDFCQCGKETSIGK